MATTPPILISVSVTPGTPVTGFFGHASPEGMPEPRTVFSPVATACVVPGAAAVVPGAAAVVSVAAAVVADDADVAVLESSSSSPQAATTKARAAASAIHRSVRIVIPQCASGRT